MTPTAARARIGFMQGRLSAPVDGRIQAFPREAWRDEIRLAAGLEFPVMEWTLDHDGLHDNPLLTVQGRERIAELTKRHGLTIPSVTGDCFMQVPFWKGGEAASRTGQEEFVAVAEACSKAGVATMVVPLVDNGRLETVAHQDAVVTFFAAHAEWLGELGVRIAFESDLPPEALSQFIAQFDAGVFGINYDIGNSAALGFDARTELATYGSRILNVHVKDRARNGPTVPLGEGDADFVTVFSALDAIRYDGLFILQTARAVDGDHAGVLCRYRDMTEAWLTACAS